jgi:hypothetical protein
LLYDTVLFLCARLWAVPSPIADGDLDGDSYKEFLQMLFWREPCFMILHQWLDGKSYAIALFLL